MDLQTLKYYAANANELAGKYDNFNGGISDYFQQSFEKAGKILDIGCGTGRDLKILHEMHYSADGIDPCDEFVELCNRNKTGYGSVVKKDSLPELKEIPDKSYGGVLCSAVLMHLPKEHLFDASFAIRRILKENGRFLMSVPLYDKTIDEKTKRDSDGRFFNGITPENFQLIFERIGFSLIGRWDNDDSLGREHRKWATLLFVLHNSSESRPIDTIESILNRDKKTATYKLALFRALAEIAITNYNLAQWLPGGKVKIPIKDVAEKWMEYFWPLMEAKIKQTTGQPCAFEKTMFPLLEYYRGNRGGQTRFSIQYKKGDLPPDALSLADKSFKDISRTIWNQPVRYAGGGDFSVFQYDKEDKTIIVGADIWRELSLTGSWIADASILRWAELASRISRNEIKPSQVIDCLLTVPIPEREVSLAKSLYDSIADKHCVWTDKTIKSKYAIDHAIPFSLWKNNDLWNLFPASNEVNSNKSDKLPTNELLKKRKDLFVYYWENARNKYPICFDYEVSKFIGQDVAKLNGGWENILFANFAEAIEITAIQRGIERWQPASFTATIPNEAKLPVSSDMGKIFEQNISSNVDEQSQIVEMDKEETTAKTAIQFFPDLKIACGTFKSDFSRTDYDRKTIEIENIHGNLDPERHFLVKASGNSMDSGNAPIKDGDMLLLELNKGGTISNQIFAVEYLDELGETSYVLKRIEKDAPGRYRLVSTNKDYPDIQVNTENMFPIARLKKNLGRI